MAMQVVAAPILLFPDELSLLILGRLSPYMLGKAACVCKQWQLLVEHPRLWEHASVEALQLTHSKSALQKLVASSYRRSWKRLFLEHPHLRFDGLYVSRNTYIRTGVTEFSRHKPVHVVVYYRYYRFFADGTLLYRTSPNTVSKIAKSMSGPRESFFGEDGMSPAPALSQAHIFAGRYLIKGTKVWSALRYPNSCSTELRARMSLRSTSPGAMNRLDMESLLTFDRESNTSASMDGNDDSVNFDEEPQGADVGRRDHKRGLASCVFVPWDQVQKSVLNLSVAEMDFFMPG